MFNSVYDKKVVLVTGNTGFKGAWLSKWLTKMGARVSGFSNMIPTNPSLFECLALPESIDHREGDIRNASKVREILLDIQPDFIFHLAAQSLVSESVHAPVDTFATNSLGTLHLLDALRSVKKKTQVVFVTSDKCYENKEWDFGYRETDQLGGKDPYSASKACAEIMFHSLFRTYFIDHPFVSMATGRAGNVIGGGDWAKDRIVPDCIRSWTENKEVVLRSPHATRPWQHVLEPLSGYLKLGQALFEKHPGINGESFNFGPPSMHDLSVGELVGQMQKIWHHAVWRTEEHELAKRESGLLKLNCDKALRRLDWRPSLLQSESIDMTARWYWSFYQEKADASQLTNDQLENYERKYRECNPQ